MKAPYGTARSGQGLVILNEAFLDTRIGKSLLVVGFGEIPTLISELLRNNDFHIGDGKRLNLHGRLFMRDI